VDYSAAEVLDWGRAAGCAFVLQSCWDYMAAQPAQPYFCGKGSINATRCTAEAAGWGVCRSSAFSDGCLLVGKYSQAGAAAVPAAAAAPSSEDGRQAACYSPPQLQRMQLMQRGSSGSGNRPPALLPLLGGSYSAARSDICYNLVQPKPEPQSSVVWVDGHGQLPEDVGRAPNTQAAAGAGSSGGSRSGSAPVQGQHQKPQQQQQQRQPEGARVSAYARYSYMDRVEAVQLQQGSAAAACVRVTPPAAAPAAAGSTAASAGRHLLWSLEQLLRSSSSSSSWQHGRSLSGVQAASSSAAVSSAAALMSADSVQAALSAQSASLLASLSGSSSRSSSTAACTASPVLCFSSNCNRQGRLLIGAALPGGRRVSFACPSRSVVDLSRALPGSYLLGFLQCPSNALVCESMGCGDCSGSGGYCSRGRCYCHMERYGKGCSQSLVPRLS
jgi:hypothetical protein